MYFVPRNGDAVEGVDTRVARGGRGGDKLYDGPHNILYGYGRDGRGRVTLRSICHGRIKGHWGIKRDGTRDDGTAARKNERYIKQDAVL